MMAGLSWQQHFHQNGYNFSLGIGYLGFGMIAAGLTRYTGSLVPAIIFSIGCALAKFLILTNYPRIITILVFLM